MAQLDRVYTHPDWYDVPRSGIADYNGIPHAYESQWADINTEDPDVFVLRPVDPQTLALALEEWDIWLRWEAAFYAKRTTIKTHPALPADRARYEEIAPLLKARLEALSGPGVRVHGTFQGHPEQDGLWVEWIRVR